MAQEAFIDGNLINDDRPLAVEIQNAAGAEAVNIQDGGNSISVDGAVTSTPVASEQHVGFGESHVHAEWRGHCL